MKIINGKVSREGFTLVEVLIVIVVLASLLAIGLPSFLSWRESVEYRSVSRSIAGSLREARSKAIYTNLQHRVEFESPDFTRYRISAGDRSTSSNVWTPSSGWSTVPTTVNLTLVSLNSDVTSTPPCMSVNFNPNGSASQPTYPSTIQIKDSNGQIRYTVQVSTVGQIVVQ